MLAKIVILLDLKIVDGSIKYLSDYWSTPWSNMFVLSQPYMMCRQCPGYRKELSSALWICEPGQTEELAKGAGDGPSTSSDTSPGYSCSHFSQTKRSKEYLKTILE